jgi:hypothetical protein
MRKSDESQLSDELLKGIHALPIQQSDVMLTDRGYLLHVVKYPSICTYEDLMHVYENFIEK